jgi:hypothetical protein
MSQSGFSWDEQRGANIGLESEMVWSDYVKANPKASPFRTRGWHHYNAMKALLPSMAKGTHVFRGRRTTQTQNDHAGSAVPERHTGHVDNGKGNAGHGDNGDGNTGRGDNDEGNRDSGMVVDNGKGNAGHGDNGDGNTGRGDNDEGNRDSGMVVDTPHLAFRGTRSVADSSDVGAPVGDVLDGEPPVSPSIHSLGKRKFAASSMSIGPGRSLDSNSVTSSFPFSEMSSKKGRLTGPIALGGLVGEFAKFNKTFEMSVATQQRQIESELPAPRRLGDPDARKSAAQHRAEKLETWLDDQHQMALMDIFHDDVEMADQYLGIKKDSLRKLWVRKRLEKLGYQLEMD